MTSKRNTKVIGFGTFDGLHPGHLSYLKQLKKLGDEICVVVARDINVRRIKSRTPRNNEKSRLKEIQKTGLADDVVLGDENDFYKCIRDFKPDIIGLGYDQRADIEELKKIFPDIRIVRLKAFKPEKHKSSLISGNRTQDTAENQIK
jgi:FAD synthetase